MIRFLQNYANGRNVLILLALYVAMVAFVMSPAEAFIKSHSGGTGPIDLVQFYGPGEARTMIGNYGAEALEYYKSFIFTGDLVYPILYTLFFGLTLLYVSRKAFPEGHFMLRLALLPFLIILFDLSENVFLFIMLNRYPDYPEWMEWAIAAMSGAKWALFFLTVALILAGLVFWGVRAVRPARG